MSEFSNEVLRVIHQRRSVRRFSREPISEPLLYEALDAANWAPSGFNLQPWYFILVRDMNLRKLLSHVAMDQAQVSDAPVTVVFVANPDAWKADYQKVLQLGEESGLMTKEKVAFYKSRVLQFCWLGPYSLFGFIKKLIVPLIRLKKPIPDPAASRAELRGYVRGQTMLAAQNFMLAAQSVGLDTSPIGAFDEYRLKKLLAIPSSMTVPIIIPTGYRLEEGEPSVRLPLSDKVKIDLF